jgi:hypothetical protein
MNGEVPPQQETPFMYPTPPMEDFGSESSLRFQLDAEELITKIRYNLLGYVQEINPKSKEKEWVKSPSKKPMISEEGMDAFEPILRGYLDKIFPLSDLEREQIENIVLKLEFSIRNMISLNFLGGNEWKIRDLATASVIKDIICDQVHATLRKAYLRGYQNFLKTIQRYTEVRSLQQRPERMEGSRGKISGIPVIGKLFG